jgi:DNA repair protein RadA/Sms
MVETLDDRQTAAAPARRGSRPHLQQLATVTRVGQDRIPIPISELNRVLGGGLVPGSVVLIGGDPGIGKSTIVLQAAALLGSTDHPVVYVSAEESIHQLKLRAERLQVDPTHILALAETDLGEILASMDGIEPALLIVDSIQTVMVPDITSAAGSVSQVRECTSRLMQWAKPKDVPVFLIGHVTKEGTIAGPRVLEHMVDAVLYLEGDRFHQYRILRAVKNRFGSTDEVGVFEMADIGLREVTNPSEAFLEERTGQGTGSAVAVTMEGTRPILVEIQALCTSTAYGLPRRSANGLDSNRLQLLVAVLQKRVGMNLGSQDVYANVIGGLRIVEPAADLAVAVALASSFRNLPVDPTTAVVGEIGLSGELRMVNQLDRRINEVARLGFKRVVVPEGSGKHAVKSHGIEIVARRNLSDAIEAALS